MAVRDLYVLLFCVLSIYVVSVSCRRPRQSQPNTDDILAALQEALLDMQSTNENGVDTQQQSSTIQTPLESEETLELRNRLDALEYELSLVENYIKGEKSTDAILEELEGSSKETFLGYMKTVEDKAKDMKVTVGRNLKPAEDTLETIKSFANERNVVIGGILYYGAIGSSCTRWEDVCITVRSECRENKCQCKPGLSSDALQQTCVEKCGMGYGKTYQTVPNYAIRGYNDLTLENVTLDTCREQCETDKSFVCRSFDYFPAWNSCYLSSSVKGDTESELSNDYGDYAEEKDSDGWEYNAAAIHFQRDCLVNTKNKQ